MAAAKGRVEKLRSRHWLERIARSFFVLLTLGSLVLPWVVPTLSDPTYASAFNAALSIGTGGVVSFIFYYVVNERLDNRKREVVRLGALQAYRDAKRNIALAIIHASQKGGRADLSADIETIDKVLTIAGFKELFEGGRESNEGFYAFANQMSERTPEYDEIIFNLKIMDRAFDRLVDTNHFNDAKSYDFFVRLDALIRRIESYGPGYDESKPLCRFIWEIFSGWNFIEGDIGYDPIDRAIENS